MANYTIVMNKVSWNLGIRALQSFLEKHPKSVEVLEYSWDNRNTSKINANSPGSLYIKVKCGIEDMDEVMNMKWEGHGFSLYKMEN